MKYSVTFVGDAKSPRDNPDSVEFRGLEFPLGKAVNLNIATDAGQAIIAKLKGNSHFVVTAGESGERGPASDVDESPPKPTRPLPDPKAAGKGKGKKAADVKDEAV